MFYAYIIRNPDGILYKGSTADLVKRIKQHNGDTIFFSFTKARGPWTLIYSESFKTRAEANAREKYFKTGKGREFIRGLIDNCS